ncbi:MAG: tetratricopeptide repeat protein [Terriglobales bacterium]
MFRCSISRKTALPLTLQAAHFWDTLGWIYFRLGEYQKAVDYLRPAWLIAQDATIGDHLGQTYQKLGKLKEAEHTYELAIASNVVRGNLRDEIRQHYKQITGKLPSETMSTHRLPDGTWSATPAEQLSRMRTIKVPVPATQHGSATFGFVFSKGKVEEVAYVDGSEELKPLADKLKAAKLDQPFPNDDVEMRLVRRGILLCHTGGCDLTFLLPDSAIINQLPAAF